MRKYFEARHKVYVKKDNEYVYEVESIEAFDGCDYLQVNLVLVAGWDYVNPDYNDIQGWCPADRFIEDVQSDFIYQYFIEESMKEALEANDYTVIKKFSNDLKKIINNSELV